MLEPIVLTTVTVCTALKGVITTGQLTLRVLGLGAVVMEGVMMMMMMMLLLTTMMATVTEMATPLPMMVMSTTMMVAVMAMLVMVVGITITITAADVDSRVGGCACELDSLRIVDVEMMIMAVMVITAVAMKRGL